MQLLDPKTLDNWWIPTYVAKAVLLADGSLYVLENTLQKFVLNTEIPGTLCRKAALALKCEYEGCGKNCLFFQDDAEDQHKHLVVLVRGDGLQELEETKAMQAAYGRFRAEADAPVPFPVGLGLAAAGGAAVGLGLAAGEERYRDWREKRAYRNTAAAPAPAAAKAEQGESD
jgi:hypothetical protein